MGSPAPMSRNSLCWSLHVADAACKTHAHGGAILTGSNLYPADHRKSEIRMLILQSVAGVAGEALLKRTLSEGFIRSKVRDCGQNAIPQSSRYNFCRCKNTSTPSSRRSAPSGFARNGANAGDSISGGEGIVELLGYYGSAFTAADSVYMQSTGWDGWDRLKRIDAPPTLLLWSKKPVK